jgi:hypothetical protein
MAAALNTNPILKKDEWDQDDIHMLFKDDNDPKELWSLIISSVGAKKLQPSRVGFTRTCRYDSSLTAIDTIYFEPITLVTWAIDKKFNLSAEVREWFDDQNKMQLNDLPVYLDPFHPMHSKELRIAIEAWLAVLNSNPSKPNTGSRKQLIENWLISNIDKDNIGNAAIKRISLMLNPDGDGGAPKSN